MVYRNRNKISILAVSILLILAATTGLASATTSDSHKSIDYVALGDSLAAGQMPTPEKDWGNPDNYKYSIGYPKIISSELSKNSVLDSYLNFGTSGCTTGAIISNLALNPTLDIAIHDAEIITLDIGANDVLPLLIQLGTDGDGLTTSEQAVLTSKITEVNQDIAQILMTIKMINADVHIYVMGYYNALYPFFPLLTPEEQVGVILLIDAFNSGLQTAIAAANLALPTSEPAKYIDAYTVMDENLDKYLPIDIHPTVRGYRVIAQAFMDKISMDLVE